MMVNLQENFRKTAEGLVELNLKLPIIFSTLRCDPSATLERRPFVGFHPLHPQAGILNGMRQRLFAGSLFR
jgi:hypothetical protein